MRIVVLFTLLIVCSLFAKAQISANYYSDGNTLGISTDTAQKNWWEIRVNTTSYIHAPWNYSDRGITQGYFCFKLLSEEKASIYSGIGVGLPLLSSEVGWASVNLPLGIQLNLFKELPNLYLVGEYMGMGVVTEDFELINTLSVGFRYSFQRQ